MRSEKPSFLPGSGSDPFIDFSNITIKREEQVILDKISLRIAHGENVAILGPNGSGKSTLIKAITREIYPAYTSEPSRQKIWGKELWSVFDLRSHFGIVSSDLQNSFQKDISGREVLLSGFFSSIGLFYHTITQSMEKKVNDIAKFLEIDHLMDKSMVSVSTGESRRFLIGRAMVHDPAYIILDEPCGNLDLSALHILRRHLRRIAEAGTGIIMVTHQIHDIIPEIERIVMIKNGIIFRDGQKTEILTCNNIRDLFSVEVNIREEDGYYYAIGY